MPLRATTVHDYRTHTRFRRFHLLHRSALGIVRALWRPMLLLPAAILYLLRPDMRGDILRFYLPPIVIISVPQVARLLKLFITPRLRVKSDKGWIGTADDYEFDSDGFSGRSTSANANSTVTVRYDALYKVYETRDFIYMYINRRQAFIVDKAKLEGGTAEELTRLISGALSPGKYVVRVSRR